MRTEGTCRRGDRQFVQPGVNDSIAITIQKRYTAVLESFRASRLGDPVAVPVRETRKKPGAPTRRAMRPLSPIHTVRHVPVVADAYDGLYTFAVENIRKVLRDELVTELLVVRWL